MRVDQTTIYAQVLDSNYVVWTWWREGVVTCDDMIVCVPRDTYTSKKFKHIITHMGGNLAPRRRKRYIE